MTARCAKSHWLRRPTSQAWRASPASARRSSIVTGTRCSRRWRSRPRRMGAMEPLLVSTITVAVAEIGDKTQLLALLLAARFRKPWPIVAGILVATLLNHALAGWLGAMAASWLTPQVLRWIVAASFIAIALWTLKPDKLEDGASLPPRGAFVATTIAFFLAEIGDK